MASLLNSCGGSTQKKASSDSSQSQVFKKGTFGHAVDFLKKYTGVIVLRSPDSLGQVVITPKMQGRVMTSTLDGDNGKSLGWINYDLIQSGKKEEHFTPYGGEDRFWLGPEGGQYSLFIKPGTKMVFDNWFVPAAFNTEPWSLVSAKNDEVTVEKKMHLSNYSKSAFDITVKRTIRMLDKGQIEHFLNIEVPSGVQSVAYVSENIITNSGNNAWTSETGAPAIWILSQFTPSSNVTVVIPYKQGSEDKLGPVATKTYFGTFTSERLKEENGIIYFKMDGKKRLKLGISPKRSMGIEGSYDVANNILTIMSYNQPEDNNAYMNQLWEHQKHPFNGNAEFAYNDGPLEDGSQLGPFFEMESTSPAAFLKPGESVTHDHRIFHFSGSEESLNKISEKVLGVSIQQIIAAFNNSQKS